MSRRVSPQWGRTLSLTRAGGALNPVTLTLLIVALTACSREPTATVLPDDLLELGRTYTSWLYTGNSDALWARFSPEARQLFGNDAGLRRFAEQVRRDAGAERALVEERLTPWLGSQIYSRVAAFTGMPRPVLVQWILNAEGLVLGLLVQPMEEPAPSQFLQYETKTPLRLPFSGEWFVFWGGRDAIDNYHVVAPDQRFAYDLVIVKNGRTHTGSGSQNADFFCFGQPILAPADGMVAHAVDGIADNTPGRMNANQPAGNQVVLDHGNGEFSFFTHLQRGSVAVQRGAQVRTGDILGRCGNSGHSSEPHLHYHLQNTAEFGRGAGLPAQFNHYIADGKPVERGEPVRGQVIRAR